MVKRGRLHSNLSDIPHKRHKLLDLRNVDRYEKFNCHKFVFQVHSQPITITTHTSSTPEEIERVDSALETVLKYGLDTMESRDIPLYAVIHLYIHCEGLEHDFKFCGSGANKVTLKQMREGKLSEIVSMFSHSIQSGRDVVLDDHTSITFYAFIPPVEDR